MGFRGSPVPLGRLTPQSSLGVGSREGARSFFLLPDFFFGGWGGSGSGARVRAWRFGRGSVLGTRSQGQKVRSTKGGPNEDRLGTTIQ